MLKTLIKKQFMELFKSYFINRKTGKGRSKAGMIGFFALFAVLMLYLCGVFFALAYGLGSAFFPVGMDWLYFTMLAIVSILLGTFGSVFNTYAGLYLAKDNDLLISMPIPPRTLLLSRLVGVYGMSLLYSGIVWLPALLCHWFLGSATLQSAVFGVLLLFVIPAVVSVLTCLLGWLVALAAGKLKNKSFVIVLLSLVFLGVYYFICFRMSNLVTSLIYHQEQIAGFLQTWGNLFYLIGRAAAGDALWMLLTVLVTAAVSALCLWVLSQTFLRIATSSGGTKKAVYHEKQGRQSGQMSALLRRELNHFTASATYMLNCGLGLVMLPVIGIVALLNGDKLRSAVSIATSAVPGFTAWFPLVLCGAIALVSSINAISTPSVSLEGKSIWLLQSMPVSPADVLTAKLLLHGLLSTVPAALTAVLLGICFRLDVWMIVCIVLFSVIYVWLCGAIGLVLGVKRPNFQWTTETTPIKQSANMLFVWLIGWFGVLPLTGGYVLLYYLAGLRPGPLGYLAVCILLLCAVTLLLIRWLRTKGANRFETL